MSIFFLHVYTFAHFIILLVWNIFINNFFPLTHKHTIVQTSYEEKTCGTTFNPKLMVGIYARNFLAPS